MRGERAAPPRQERRAAFSETTLIFAVALLTRLIYRRLHQMQVHGGHGKTKTSSSEEDLTKRFNVLGILASPVRCGKTPPRLPAGASIFYNPG